jgi:phytoene dehydrogenase-like protein
MTPAPPQNGEVVIVGGGVSGLSCARHLHAEGVRFTLLEAADRVGGRIRTDEAEGYRLDRGFQVLQTAYPEARRILDYARLDLCRFAPGAKVRIRGRFHTVADPLRRPHDL